MNHKLIKRGALLAFLAALLIGVPAYALMGGDLNLDAEVSLNDEVVPAPQEATEPNTDDPDARLQEAIDRETRAALSIRVDPSVLGLGAGGQAEGDSDSDDSSATNEVEAENGEQETGVSSGAGVENNEQGWFDSDYTFEQ